MIQRQMLRKSHEPPAPLTQQHRRAASQKRQLEQEKLRRLGAWMFLVLQAARLEASMASTWFYDFNCIKIGRRRSADMASVSVFCLVLVTHKYLPVARWLGDVATSAADDEGKEHGWWMDDGWMMDGWWLMDDAYECVWTFVEVDLFGLNLLAHYWNPTGCTPPWCALLPVANRNWLYSGRFFATKYKAIGDYLVLFTLTSLNPNYTSPTLNTMKIPSIQWHLRPPAGHSPRYAEGLPAESPERGRPPLLPSLDARRVAKVEDTGPTCEKTGVSRETGR